MRESTLFIAVLLICRSLLLFLSFIYIFDAVIEFFLLTSYFRFLSSFVTRGHWWSSRVTGDLLTEFVIADGAVGIVVTPTEDCLLVFSPRVELVLLAEAYEV